MSILNYQNISVGMKTKQYLKFKIFNEKPVHMNIAHIFDLLCIRSLCFDCLQKKRKKKSWKSSTFLADWGQCVCCMFSRFFFFFSFLIIS